MCNSNLFCNFAVSNNIRDMKANTKQLEYKVRELFTEFDSDIIAIGDFDIMTQQGTPITHITNGSTDGSFAIGLWCGDPENDKHAEEMIVGEEERANIYNEINKLM